MRARSSVARARHSDLLHFHFPRQLIHQRLQFLVQGFARLSAIASGQDPQRVAEEWLPALSAFEEKRQKALLYGP